MNKGFTYVELLVSMAVMGMAAAAGYEALRQDFSGFEQIRLQSAEHKKIAAIETKMRHDVRTATLVENEFIFSGTKDRFDFIRAGIKPDSFWEIGYFVRAKGDKLELWRRIQESVDNDKLTGGRTTLLCGDIRTFQVRYFDGSTWVDSYGWNSERGEPSQGVRGLPLAVKVDVSWFDKNGDPQSKEMMFPVMVAILNWPGFAEKQLRRGSLRKTP